MSPIRNSWFALGAAVFLVLLAANPALAGLDRGPWVQNVTQTSARLLYEGDSEDGDGLVEYGTSPSYGYSVTATKRFIGKEYYWAALSGLDPSTQYYYRLTHEGGVKDGSFFTAPASADEPFTFAVIGDTRSGHTAHQSLVDGIVANDGYPDLYFNTGDLVASGSNKDDWTTFFSIEDDILRHTVYCPSYGNHEVPALFQPNLYAMYFESGATNRFWYGFAYGNAYFLVLNTQAALGGAQGTFVDEKLQEARSNPDIDFVFVIFHQPGVTTSDAHAPNLNVLKILLDKFETYNVDAVFNGHNHLYENGIVNGVRHVVTGGGGAGLYDYIDPYTPEGWTLGYRESVNHYCYVTVSVDSYTMECKYADGSVFDSFTGYVADGGFAGPTPPDLLSRANPVGCGGFVTNSLIRVEDVEASQVPSASIDTASLATHVTVNGLLYAVPAVFMIGLRRRIRRRR